ncbi:MAG: TetR/AcrR family transcriptional regulator [Lachnospiraceae bacterium]|nr:TetR/AcrR family transcriptional regulator [Lachnospiraceae bacterium]
MPKDKTESHAKIVAAAFEEFLKYGFKDASMRRIAANCGMSASGLYKHFPGKEEMFSALVSPAYDGLIEQYNNLFDEEIDTLSNVDAEDIWADNSETEWIIRYIYEHFDAFKLLVCHSQGTRYENYIHDLAVVETKTTELYFEKMKNLAIPFKKIPAREYHLFVTSAIDAIFRVVEHDFTEEEAIQYAKHLDVFYAAGWRRLMLSL